jgi:integrase
VNGVTVADADAYVAHMVASGLAKATVAKRSRHARHFFEVAKRRGLVDNNPFSHIKQTVKGNPGRRAFVPGEVVAKVIDVVPDPQWKLMIAPARWGGLRVPSEILALRWQDVDFANGRLVVHASKTAHHDDGGVRVVPIFSKIAEYLQRVFDEADEGSSYAIARYRKSSTNLRTQFQRYINNAGVKPWPKLWQNLRASRATELADIFPSHVCAAWLGHTERVADAHYRTVTDDHFKRAIGAAQNPAQQVHANSSNGRHSKSGERSEVNCKQPLAAVCDCLQGEQMGDTGLEPVTSRV